MFLKLPTVQYNYCLTSFFRIINFTKFFVKMHLNSLCIADVNVDTSLRLVPASLFNSEMECQHKNPSEFNCKAAVEEAAAGQ